jgi:acyl-CoA reductase-like NAD-dependent aldehyde dehydrogenase
MSSQYQDRAIVLKTYKLYIGGQFPRTESGRTYQPLDPQGKALGNVCLASKKDLRDAVGAAQKSWAGKTAYNRGQILYRIAELMEGRRSQFIEELISQGSSHSEATYEVNASIDRCIYYAGWCDKYQQLYSTVNAVASSHFNFSVTEPIGVVAVLSPSNSGLLGLISFIAPIIAGGNTCIILASESKPIAAISLAEVIHASDVPGAVVNILTGKHTELGVPMAAHMDINAMVVCDASSEMQSSIQAQAAAHIQRVHIYDSVAVLDVEGQSPYKILDFQEVKTTWHPIDTSISGGGKY